MKNSEREKKWSSFPSTQMKEENSCSLVLVQLSQTLTSYRFSAHHALRTHNFPRDFSRFFSHLRWEMFYVVFSSLLCLQSQQVATVSCLKSTIHSSTAQMILCHNLLRFVSSCNLSIIDQNRSFQFAIRKARKFLWKSRKQPAKLQPEHK